jgi:hypothetical protein
MFSKGCVFGEMVYGEMVRGEMVRGEMKIMEVVRIPLFQMKSEGFGIFD